MIGERETSWTRAELVKSALDLGLKGVTAEGVEARMQQLVESGQVLAGKSTRIDGVPDRYTTPEHRMIERSTLDNVARGKGASLGMIAMGEAPARLQEARRPTRAAC